MRFRTLAIPANIVPFKNCAVVGVDYGPEMDGSPALRERLARVFSQFAQGWLRPLVSARYPLAPAALAIRRLVERSVPGKVVLEI